MPVMKAVGTNTEQSTRAIAITGPATSPIARRAASRAGNPPANQRSTFSTTTIASSTTIPMASTRPNSERLLREKPNSRIAANVPTSDTGTATIGMIVARQSWRKTRTTMNTSTTASKSVFQTSRTLSSTNTVVS